MRPPHNAMGPGMPGVNMYVFLPEIKTLPSDSNLENVAELSFALSLQGPRDWTAMAQSQQCQLCEC